MKRVDMNSRHFLVFSAWVITGLIGVVLIFFPELVPEEVRGQLWAGFAALIATAMGTLSALLKSPLVDVEDRARDNHADDGSANDNG